MLSELACFAYARDLLRGKVRESEYDSFGLHLLKLLEIDMANSLVPYIQIGFDFEAFCKHGRLHFVRLEDENLTFLSIVSYELSVFSTNHPSLLIQPHLHALFYLDLAG